ncbi:MAG: 30S ribosomal protein S4 [archaeon]
MGDPKKTRRKYDTPTHPWFRTRIEEEKKVLKEFGLKTKKDIWKMETILRGFKDQVKNLASRFDDQSKLEEQQLISRLNSLGLTNPGDQLDKVLGLELKDILNRRLQTLLVKKGLARSMKQSRQFITHGHVLVDKKKITFPSYLVGVKEEGLVEFVPTSSLFKEDHPERVIKESAKDKAGKKKKESKEEAPPTFSEDEIKKIEETGAVEKKRLEEKAAAELKAKEEKEKVAPVSEAKKEEHKSEKKEHAPKDKPKKEKHEKKE